MFSSTRKDGLAVLAADPGRVTAYPEVIPGVLFARRNLRLAGAIAVELDTLQIFFAVWAVSWSFGAHHISSFDEFGQIFMFLSFGISFSCFFWVLYIAMEPYG